MAYGDQYGNPMGQGPGFGPFVRFSAIGEAWALLLGRLGTWVIAALIATFCYAVLGGVVFTFFHVPQPRGVGGFRWTLPHGASALEVVITAIVVGFFVGGMTRMACRQVRGEPFGIDDLFGSIEEIGELALGCAFYSVIVFAALFCLVIPGLILHGVLMFTIPLIVDARLPATTALSRSFHALKGQWLEATLFHFCVSMLSGLGSCCCIGILLTAPLYALSVAVLYRDFFPGGPRFKEKPAPHDRDF